MQLPPLLKFGLEHSKRISSHGSKVLLLMVPLGLSMPGYDNLKSFWGPLIAVYDLLSDVQNGGIRFDDTLTVQHDVWFHAKRPCG